MSQRLYLDSRDLIELVANSRPIKPAHFADILTRHAWRLVYSFANVCETTIPTDLVETRRRARLLSAFPHTFIRAITPIRCLEFTAAIRAFELSGEPQPIDPFVNHWHETFLYPQQDRQMAAAANITFEDQVVFMVKNNPNVCRNLPAHTANVQRAVEQDRAVTDAVRRNRQRFEGGVAVALHECRLRMPHRGKKEFARWIRQDPSRCPAWRLFDEGYLKFASNVSDSVDHGDMNDWSHVSSLPYVNAITLDRRIAAYARAASSNLERLSTRCSYSARIFANTSEWLNLVGDA